MLSGTYRHTLDAKGRVIVPVRFRGDLGEIFMVTRGLDDCLALYSMKEWQRLEEKIAALPMASSRQIQRYLFANAYPAEIDNNGRTVIPPELREFAGLTKDVVIVGVSSRAEIWDAGRWEQSEVSSPSTSVTQMMIELGL